ncbi:MAG: FAD-dependent oxidoreductase [Calditrichaeota bacterium]|nr:FAD-dependent oxidoreductase [Calditrichota bacterium]
MNHTLILGAGPAGLAAGHYLTQAGHTVTLLEGASAAGGFARTFTHGPFRYDTGAHRFHDKDPEITRELLELMGDEMMQVHSPSQICWNGKYLNFPLSPGNVARRIGASTCLRAGVDLLRARLIRREAQENFAENAYHKYGRTIADAFLIGYSEKLWGVPADKLTPAVSGGRLKGLRARTMFYELLRGKRGKTEHLDGSFYYPRQGYGQISARLIRSIGQENILVNSTITRLAHDGHCITRVELANGETFSPTRVINSIAPEETLRLLNPAPPEELLDRARTLKYRDLILVALFLNKQRVSNNASIYFPNPDIPFTRLYEPKNRSLELAPPRQTCAVVEIPCFAGDATWSMADTDLEALVTDELKKLNLLEMSDVMEGKVHRLRKAYPVLELGTDAVIEEIRDYLRRFANLYTVGRVGKFEYTHVHDLLRQGKELATLLSIESVETRALDNV